MADISLVEINELTATSSTDKDLLFAIDLPSGGGFAQFKISKENLFKIAADMAIEFSGQSATLINIDDGQDIALKYLDGAHNVFFENLKRLFFTNDGSTAELQLINDAEAEIIIGSAGKEGRLHLYDANANFASFLIDLSTLSSDLPITIDSPRVDGVTETTLRYREDDYFQYIVPPNGLTTEIKPAQVSTLIAHSSGIAGHTFEMPAPTDGDRVKLVIKGDITTVTMTTPGSETIDQALTTASTFTTRTWLYVASETEWMRID